MRQLINEPFTLFTSPPRCDLDLGGSFWEAGLTPNAVINLATKGASVKQSFTYSVDIQFENSLGDVDYQQVCDTQPETSMDEPVEIKEIVNVLESGIPKLTGKKTPKWFKGTNK